MKRREFITLLGGATAWPLIARAQQQRKVSRVGYLFSVIRAEGQDLWKACQQGLRELGYVEGQNIIFEPRWAEGQHKRLPALAADLVRLNVDVIVSAGTPASLAAKAATSKIPIVVVAVGEPVKTGLITSLARPGGNVTGMSLLTSDLSGKRLELLLEIVRNVSRVALIMNPENQMSAIFLEETQDASRKLGIELQQSEARNPQEIERAFARAASERASALIVFDDQALWSYRAQFVALAAAQKIPAMYGFKEFVGDGGLMSYGPDRPDQYRRTAIFVDKLLKGANPADLPVEQPTKFELVINLKTAKALGLTVPLIMQMTADEVIE